MWLHSPIVYLEKGSFAQVLRELAPKAVNAIALCYHYSHMARGNARGYLVGDEVTLENCAHQRIHRGRAEAPWPSLRRPGSSGHPRGRHDTRSAQRDFPKSSRKGIFVLIVATALLLNATLLVLSRWPASKGLLGDEGAYLARASEIAQGTKVRRPMLWPPGYDSFLALPMRLAMTVRFPVPPFAAQLLQVALWCLAGLTFWQVTSLFVPEPGFRLIALSLFLLNPTLIAFSHYFWPEIPHLTLYLLALWILGRHPVSVPWNGVLGALLASATLLKLVYLPISIAILLFLPLLHHRREKSWSGGLIAWLGFAIVLAPASLDRLETHGTWLVADSSAFNLWVGLNDRERTDLNRKSIVGPFARAYMASAPSHALRSERAWKEIRAHVTRQGLAKTFFGQLNKQYFRLFDHRTFFTKQLPGGMRPTYRFSSALLSSFFRAMNDFVWALTLVGVGLSLPRCLSLRRSWMLVPLGFIGYNLLIFLFLHVKTRYVIQFLPMLCWLAALGLIEIRSFLSKLVDKETAAPSKKEFASWIMGALLSVLLLGLGFHDLLLP